MPAFFVSSCLCGSLSYDVQCDQAQRLNYFLADLVTVRDGFLAAIVGIPDSNGESIRQRFEDGEIQRRVRKIHVAGHCLQYRVALSEELVRRFLREIQHCL